MSEQKRKYSFLGPAGTFTEAALKQVPEARGQQWVPVATVSQALDSVVTGTSDAAMIAIENSIDGGVAVTQDALARLKGVQIVGEYLVAVDFVLITLPGVQMQEITNIAAHPVAYAQCRAWLEENLPHHKHIPASSNAQAAADLSTVPSSVQAALAPPTITEHYRVHVHAKNLAENRAAQTRFVLVAKNRPASQPTGYDKTSLIFELPEERPGALLAMLEQFAGRGVNLTQIASRPIGDRMGRYRFYVDAEGHIRDKRVREAVIGLKRLSPKVIYLGSYPRADKESAAIDPCHTDAAIESAANWLDKLIAGA